MLQPFTRIVVDKKEEGKFRRRALRSFPQEYIEAMWGYVRGETLYVCVFMPMNHKNTKRRIKYEYEELDDHEDQAKEDKLHFLGTIHSHPDVEHACVSQGDVEDCQETQEAVMAICGIKVTKKGTRIIRRQCIMNYWPTMRPLTVEYRSF